MAIGYLLDICWISVGYLLDNCWMSVFELFNIWILSALSGARFLGSGPEGDNTCKQARMNKYVYTSAPRHAWMNACNQAWMNKHMNTSAPCLGVPGTLG